jgi:hypothetical protein
MEEKPGYLTTEFWISLATALAGVAVASGWIGDSEVNAWVTLAGILGPIIAGAIYTWSRTQIKKDIIITKAAEYLQSNGT